MDKPKKLFLFFISTSIYVLLIINHPPSVYAATNNLCDSSTSCSPIGPIIQSPFWLNNKQQSRNCGPQGFALTCNNKNQTILNLPFSGEFSVKYIDYASSFILINDPDSCLPFRILNLTLSSSPFRRIRPLSSGTSYKFVNCSGNVTEFTTDNFVGRPVRFSCLSGQNHSVFAVSSLVTDQELPSSCFRVSSNSSNSFGWVDSSWWSFMTRRGDIGLEWIDTRCFSCAAQGLSCGVSDDGNQMKCISYEKRGLPRSAKYGIIIGVGIPALVFITGLVCYACGWVRVHSFRRGRAVADFSTTISPQSFPSMASGLDGMVIESYPKTVLGESRRLPKPNESTCAICLSEYRPKEALRTLPNCEHYFHCDCIDEWLRLNGSCPLCRNSPESRPITPRPSISSSTTTPPS